MWYIVIVLEMETSLQAIYFGSYSSTKFVKNATLFLSTKSYGSLAIFIEHLQKCNLYIMLLKMINFLSQSE